MTRKICIWENTFTIGGDDPDGGYAITTDSSDNILITGYFHGTVDFDPTPAVDAKTSQGDRDIFITKIFADGSYAWTNTIGGADWDDGHDIITDSSDNVIIAGLFSGSVDFNPSRENTHYISSHGDRDAFVTKLDDQGDYLWTKTFGGSKNDAAYGLDIDSLDNIYIAGEFMNTVDFDPATENGLFTAVNFTDIYVTKLQSTGEYVWTKTYGGDYYDRGRAVAVDDDGNIFVTGHWGSMVDFDFSDGVDYHYSAGVRDIFVTKINADNSYGWTASFGSNINDDSYDIEVDSQGNAYFTGMFYNTVDFDPTDNTDEHISNGLLDVFITKLNANGDYAWTATLGSEGMDIGNDIFIDNSDNIYTTGVFDAFTDFNPLDPSDYFDANGDGDVFITKYIPNFAPTIGSIEAQPYLVTRGENLTLTAHNVADSESNVTAVQFFFDGNYNGSLEVNEDTLLFEDNSAQDGWSWTGSTLNFMTGENFFFARALDSGGAVSNSVSTTAEINEKPYVDALTITPDPVPLGQTITLEALEITDDQLPDTMPLVEFYFDANDNGILDPLHDTLLGTDANGADGWTWTGPTTHFPIGPHSFFVRAQDRHGAWSDSVETTGTIESFHTQAGFPTSKTIKFTDLDGSEVTIKFNNVTANLVFCGDFHDLLVSGTTTTILDDTNLLYIQLLNSNPSGKISFNVKNGDGQTTLAGLTGGSLGKLNGKNVDLIGDIDLTGSLSFLALDDIEPNVSVAAGAPSPKGIKINADQISDQVHFNLKDNVKKFQTSTFQGGSLVADVINNMKVKEGNLDADVSANVGEINKLFAGGSIRGNINSATSINSIISKTGGINENILISAQLGNIRKITAAKTIAARITSQRSIGNITSKTGGFTGEAHAKENIGIIKVGDFQGALIAAGRNINHVNAAGNIAASFILAGYDSDAMRLGDGQVNQVTANGTFIGSCISAGVLPPVSSLPVVLPGVQPPYTGLGHSGNIGKVKFGAIDQNATDDFGLYAANEIKPVQIGTQTFNESNLALKFFLEDNLG